MYSTPSKKRKAGTPSRPTKGKKMKTMGSGKSEAPLAVSRSFAMGRPIGIPKKLIVTLRYYQPYVTADPPAGGVLTNVFRANSIFDPDFSGVGGQPLGTDQYFALYSVCTVKKSKITVTAINTGTSGVIYGATLSPSSTTLLTAKEYVEQQTTGYAYQQASLHSINQTAKSSFDAKVFFDVKDPSDEDDLQCSSGLNPVRPAYYHVWVGAYSGAADPTASTMNVLIEYQCEFSQPVQLNSS